MAESKRVCPADRAAVLDWLGPQPDLSWPVKVVSGVKHDVVTFEYPVLRRNEAEQYVRRYGGHVIDLREGAPQHCPCTETKSATRKKA